MYKVKNQSHGILIYDWNKLWRTGQDPGEPNSWSESCIDCLPTRILQRFRVDFRQQSAEADNPSPAHVYVLFLEQGSPIAKFLREYLVKFVKFCANESNER